MDYLDVGIIFILSQRIIATLLEWMDRIRG